MVGTGSILYQPSIGDRHACIYRLSQWGRLSRLSVSPAGQAARAPHHEDIALHSGVAEIAHLTETTTQGTGNTISDAHIEGETLAVLAHREADSSACPSEVARALAPSDDDHWRALMPRVRYVIADLARKDWIVVTRGSRTLDPDDLEGGPIRIRRGPRFDERA